MMFDFQLIFQKVSFEVHPNLYYFHRNVLACQVPRLCLCDKVYNSAKFWTSAAVP